MPRGVYDHWKIRGKNNPNWRSRITKICEYCGKGFEVKSFRKDRRFCSQDCCGKWRSENIRGKNSPFWKPKIERKCKQCGKKFKVYPYLIEKDFGKYCSFKCYGLSLKNKPSIVLGKHWKLSETAKTNIRRHLRDPEFIKKRLRSLHKRPTKPEQKVIEIINKHFSNEFKYNGDCSQGIVLGGLIPDFIGCNGKKKVIEVFGDYWHREKENIGWKRTEFGRKTCFSQLGYDCLILWEHELKNSTRDEIIHKIGVFVNG